MCKFHRCFRRPSRCSCRVRSTAQRSVFVAWDTGENWPSNCTGAYGGGCFCCCWWWFSVCHLIEKSKLPLKNKRLPRLRARSCRPKKGCLSCFAQEDFSLTFAGSGAGTMYGKGLYFSEPRQSSKKFRLTGFGTDLKLSATFCNCIVWMYMFVFIYIYISYGCIHIYHMDLYIYIIYIVYTRSMI